jgi:hypothetical protein
VFDSPSPAAELPPLKPKDGLSGPPTHDLSRGDTLWHSLGFEFTVGMGVENSGHFAGFVPKEPFHPTVFPAEERVVLAGEKFEGFLVPGLREFGESIAFANNENVAFAAAVDQSAVAHSSRSLA